MSMFIHIKDHCIIVDDEDWQRVSELTWTPVKKGKNFYFVNNHTTRKYLHQFVLGYKKDTIIDHINTNTLDNRKENLRYTDKSGNAFNTKEPRIDNKSGYTGISWDKSRNKWIVRVREGKVYKYLGRFEELKDAVKIIDDYNLKRFGYVRR